MYMPHVSFDKTSDWKPPNTTRWSAPSTAHRIALPTKSSTLANSNSSRTAAQAGYFVGRRFLRRVVFQHHGFGDALNDTIIDEEKQYLNNRIRLRLETAYDQKIADDMKKELENFWKSRGITVKVTTNLTQVPTAPRYVILEVHIYRK